MLTTSELHSSPHSFDTLLLMQVIPVLVALISDFFAFAVELLIGNESRIEWPFGSTAKAIDFVRLCQTYE